MAIGGSVSFLTLSFDFFVLLLLLGESDLDEDKVSDRDRDLRRSRSFFDFLEVLESCRFLSNSSNLQLFYLFCRDRPLEHGLSLFLYP
jgi:hypothetical protein